MFFKQIARVNALKIKFISFIKTWKLKKTQKKRGKPGWSLVSKCSNFFTLKSLARPSEMRVKVQPSEPTMTRRYCRGSIVPRLPYT